ncbi:DUF192 domain-containing protein [Candidatus Pandoraea novymonadis]|uniref:DUF192 domain-containing protein n=1 Tax=Candidatus Pandoraea novymonadis TaxID=1808959 RepID=A0ABX5FDP1_9BURK|nr:DUF192 domain-containing protein [Candidatus Pandoraea novymonadis]PSB91825.1 hypothetical protein BZL35_00039 [Candidatus Pandoraea novymonadis]
MSRHFSTLLIVNDSAFAIFSILLAILPLHAAGETNIYSALPVIQLSADFFLIRTEVAANKSAREQGLMHRTILPENQGMLFIFEKRNYHCFWMKNTMLPLSIGFLDDDGTILNIEEMIPKTQNTHCPHKPILYALEMNQGWFRNKGIHPGKKITGLPAHAIKTHASKTHVYP